MAVYEYLCPKCGEQFNLMRPMSEAEKPTNCPKCDSKVQKLISSFGSKTGNSIQPAGEPFRQSEVDNPRQLALSPDLAGNAIPLFLSGDLNSGASIWGRETAQKSLLQKLEDLSIKIRSLEREKSQVDARIKELESEKERATATIGALEREVCELGALIALASEKVNEILKEGTTADIS